MIDVYNWLDNELNSFDSELGFTQQVAATPLYLSEQEFKKAEERNSTIREFQKGCFSVLKDALRDSDVEVLSWVINDTPSHMRENYLRSLPDEFWQTPVFFRTDENPLGKILEVQCPGSAWGELQLLYNFLQTKNIVTKIKSPAQNFTAQLQKYCKLQKNESPLVFYLVDNASEPIGVRYFISETRKTTPPIKYWGIDKFPVKEGGQKRAIDAHFVRTHYYAELFAECDFMSRVRASQPKSTWYDLPPMSLFDQKAILVLPFWEKTRSYFSDKVREIFVYSYPIISDKLVLENGETVTIEEFSKKPQSQRRYWIKYAGTDASTNWGSRDVFNLSKYGSAKFEERLYKALREYQTANRPSIIQIDSTGSKAEVDYYDKSKGECVFLKGLNTKYSFYCGPYGVIGGVLSLRPEDKVHGQPNTIIQFIDRINLG